MTDWRLENLENVRWSFSLEIDQEDDISGRV